MKQKESFMKTEIRVSRDGKPRKNKKDPSNEYK